MLKSLIVAIGFTALFTGFGSISEVSAQIIEINGKCFETKVGYQGITTLVEVLCPNEPENFEDAVLKDKLENTNPFVLFPCVPKIDKNGVEIPCEKTVPPAPPTPQDPVVPPAAPVEPNDDMDAANEDEEPLPLPPAMITTAPKGVVGSASFQGGGCTLGGPTSIPTADVAMLLSLISFTGFSIVSKRRNKIA